MPVSTRTQIMKKDLGLYYEECLNNRTYPALDTYWDAGSVHQYTQSSIIEFGYCIVFNDHVIITKYPGKLHTAVNAILSNNVCKAFRHTFGEDNVLLVSELKIPTYQKYHCGSLLKKIPDGAILYSPLIFERRIPIVIEVAISHETLGMLVMNAIHYLQVYTCIEYSLNISINPSSENFQARIFLLRRIRRSINKMVSNVEKECNKENLKSCFQCKEKVTDLKYFRECLLRNSFGEFDVELMFHELITSPFREFTFDIYPIDQMGNVRTVTIMISVDDFEVMRHIWQQERERRRAE